VAAKLPDQWEAVVQQWRDGRLPHGRMAQWVSRHLGELLDTDLIVDELKEIAREVASRQSDERAVPGFEIAGATTYTTRYADYKALMEAKDAILALSPDAWMVIEEYVIKERVTSRAASVRFVGSEKAIKREAKRKVKAKEHYETG
jgi:hypothetical protein